MTDEPKRMLTLAEEVAKVVAAAPKPLPLTGVKSELAKAGVQTTGKGKVTDAEIEVALGGEGVHQHPPKKDGGKPTYWHQAPKSAEELAAEAEAAKAAKAAEAARKKEAKATATAQAKAENKALKDAEDARKKEEKALATAQAKAEKKAAKDAEAARRAAAKEQEKAAKALQTLREKIHLKVAQLDDQPIPLSRLAKIGDDTKPELRDEFDRVVKQLLHDKKLFEHPNGKYGRKPYEAPPPPKWYEKPDAKKKLAAFVKAAANVLALEGSTREYLIQKLLLGGTTTTLELKPPQEPASSPPIDLKAFAADVMDVTRGVPSEGRFHDNKVFIVAAWRASQGRAGFPKMGLADFKQRLVEANQQHLLHLSRADEVQMMNADQVKESETFQLSQTFHFILV